MASHFNLRLLLITLCLVLCANAKRIPKATIRLSANELLPIVEKQIENPDPLNDDTKSFATLDAAKALDLAGEDPEVKRVCRSTDYPLLCAAAVIPSIKGTPTVDTIFGAAVHAGTGVAKKAKILAKQIALRPDIPPEMMSIVKDCKNSYSTTIENFEKAMTAISKHDMGTVLSMLSGSLTFLGQCQDDIVKVPAASALRDYARRLSDMNSNCLAIAGLMI